MQEIESANLTPEFKKIKSGTVFAPVNEAFDHKLITQRRLNANSLLYHVVPLSIDTNDLWDGRVLETEARIDDVDQRVKVHKSLTRTVTLGPDNGQESAKIVDSNIEATNGVVHAIDKILPLPVYLDETLSLSSDTQEFYDYAKIAKINHELRNAQGNTIFVSKGEVFGDALSDYEKEYLLHQEAGRHDLARYLNHQIVPKVFYAGDFKEGKTALKTVEGSEDLEIVVQNKTGFFKTITVNGVKIIHSDVLAANGVIHVLEEPLLPKNKDFIKLTARKALHGLNASRFIDLFDENGLGSYLDNDESDVITILAPPNDALENDFSPIFPNIKTREWLKYHIVHGRFEPSDLIDGQLLETESHYDLGEDHYQRLDVHIATQNRGFKDTIQFGKAGVLGDPVHVGKNLIIYPISNALDLPRDALSRLPVNLDLSTFVASLYASDADHVISKAHAITLFAPTNEAFSRLGLTAKYLLQPESKEKLEQVVTYHAVRGLFYENSTSEGEHHETTLSSGSSITLNKTADGFFLRGSGAADGEDRSVIAKVVESDILISNGVIHTVDRVEIPNSVEITNKDLLSAEGTTTLLRLLDRANLTKRVLEGLDKNKPYTILAPTDRAFGKLDISHLLENPDKLLAVARLHILPIALPRLDLNEVKDSGYRFGIFGKNKDDDKKREDRPDVPYIGTDIPTLLDDEYVVISKNVLGGYTVRVKGTITESSDVLDIGHSTSGGGVISIDRVLEPKEVRDEHGGLAWWKIALIVIGSFIGAALLAVAAFFGWRYYQSRRDGNISLGR